MKTIPAWFESQVQQHPEGLALIDGPRSLTYMQLNLHANELGKRLQILPLKPDMCIAVCMERSLEQIISILAILKVGCAYVPFDPAQPAARLTQLMQASGISVLLLSSAEKPLFAGFTGHCIFVDKITPLPKNKIMQPIQLANAHTIDPQDLAYVIYTSGTTGKPKGVMIEHQSLVNFSQWYAEYAESYPTQRIDCSGNYIFDTTVSTSIVPLMLGMTVVLCPDMIKKDTGAFVKHLKENKVSVVKISPSYFKELISEVEQHHLALPDLTMLVLCGERILTADCKRWLACYPKQTISNEYGPTEATIAVTHQKIDKHSIGTFDVNIPIGQPGKNMPCYILNEQNKQVPLGEKGELHIGGLCLARGYLNQEKLTQEKFITNPISNQKKATGYRLYKTGDLCRQLSDGTIDYLGRIDKQIKIRGFRIEPGEIEVCLREHLAIKDALVLGYENEHGEKSLVAYCIVREKNLKLSFPHMRKHLQQQLPDYMIPNAFIEITKIPLTPNTKLDYKALPKPTLSSSHMYVAPKTLLEKKLTKIWSKELGIPLISIQDNFFELGGHSLQAARIVSEINHLLKKKLTIKDFYLHETVADLAIFIKNLPKKSINYPIRSTKKVLKDKKPLSDFQLFLWMLKTFEPNLKKLNIVSRKRWQGKLNIEALNHAFKDLFKRHEILSYTFTSWYPAQYAKIYLGKPFTIHEMQLLKYSKRDAEAKLLTSMKELNNYNEWSNQGPQMIARLFYLKNNAMELQICVPHLIADEPSVDIIWRDLSTFYQEKCNPKQNQLPTLTTPKEPPSFLEYVMNEKNAMEKHFEPDKFFWENYLKNTGLFTFPQKHIIHDMAKTGLTYSTYEAIPESILHNLEQYCALNQIGLSAVLYAAVGLSLKKVTSEHKAGDNNDPLLLSIVKSTREDEVWDNTIGCFLRVDPIKVELGEKATLLSIAKQIQQTFIENNTPMQASSILKMASIGTRNTRKTWDFLLKGFIGFYLKILSFMDLDYKSLQLLSNLYWVDRKNDYMICINLRNNFTNSFRIGKELTWDTQEEERIKMQELELENIDNVCDISFLRDEDKKMPYTVISSNLQPAFRQKIAHEIIATLGETK
ncbi:MAG: amino acid adenylation domain-containing protein [Legionella sp.]|nr:amino acid adenylation domain-containing protein [Legionella sp.]